MGYLTNEQLQQMGFKSLGDNVKISSKASIYNADLISIGNNVRIDDFCVISGKIDFGDNIHIAPMCLVAGGRSGIVFEDFSGLAYACQVFTRSDDYSGATMTNPTIPTKFKNESEKTIKIGKHSIIGAGSIIMPGANLAEGTSIGAGSLVRKPTQEWSIYIGNPARKIKNRKKELLELEQLYKQEQEVIKKK